MSASVTSAAGDSWPPGDGEMAGRVRTQDWAATPLGACEAWSAVLKTMVEQVLACPLVASLTCGRERLLIYNDAAARLYGDRHPAALGRPLPESFPEGWASVAPFYARAFTGVSVTVAAQALDTRGEGDRDADVFDAYLTPVREAGAVAHVHMIGIEIGARVRAEIRLRESEERQRFLLALSDTLRPLDDPDEIRAGAARLLGERLGVDRAAYGEAGPDGAFMSVTHGWTRTGAPPVVGRYRMDDFGRFFIHPLHEGATSVMEDALNDPRVSSEAYAEAWEAIHTRAAVAHPLVKRGRLVAAIYVHHEAPRRWSAAEIALVAEVGERTWEAVERARAEAALRESEERFRQFAVSSSDALWIRDAGSLAMEYVSPAIRTIYGVTPEAILGEPARWTALIVPEDRDTARDHIEQARAGASVVHEFRILRPSDGEERWIRNTDFPLLDAQGRVQRIGGIAEDVTDAKRASQRLEVLVNELQHRSRNVLGVVAAVAARTLGDCTQVAAFDTRLKALSRAQGLLSQQGSDTVELGALVRAELAAHSDAGAGRVSLSGPRIHLSARQVQNFALALHELTTNAVKYGALKQASGQLSVSWQRRQDAKGRPRLALDWVERGVALPPDAGARRGSGRELIENALSYSLRATTDYAFASDGVRCRIELPLA